MFQQNPKEAEVLSKRHFGIVGCGSIGGAITDMLVRAGARKFTLVDPETFKIDHLARHVLTRTALDKYKCEALKDHILSINPDREVNAIAASFQAPVECNFIVSAVDSYQCERAINAFAMEKRIPAMYVGCWEAAIAGEVFMYVPRRSACYECYSIFRKKSDIPLGQKTYTDLNFDHARVPGQPGLWGNILFISATACQVIFDYLIRNRFFVTLPLRIVNVSSDELPFRHLNTIAVRVKKRCGVCGPLKIVRTTKRVVIEE